MPEKPRGEMPKPSPETKAEGFDAQDFVVSAAEVSKSTEALVEELSRRLDSETRHEWRFDTTHMSPELLNALNDDFEKFHRLAIDCRDLADKIKKTLEDLREGRISAAVS